MTAPQIALLVTGSPQDETVLRTATRLARTWRPIATVVLLRVLPSSALLRAGDGAALVDLAVREADRQLRACAAALPGVSVRREVLVGSDAAKKVALWLTEHQVCAVVVPQARRGRWFRRGRDVAGTLARQATVPVVIAPAIFLEDEADAELNVNAVLTEAERMVCGR